MDIRISFILSALLGYLLGCSNMALYLSKLKNIDLRQKGSGNLGASNAMIVMGWKYGIIVGIHDIGKALLASFAAKLLFPGVPVVSVIAGVAAVLGHMFPFYLKFRGGKGLASFVGMTIGLDIRLAACVAVGIILITLITDYIVLGTVATVISVPVYSAFVHGTLFCVIILLASIPILYAHRANYVRIYNGTEIGLRGANRGDHRADSDK